MESQIQRETWLSSLCCLARIARDENDGHALQAVRIADRVQRINSESEMPLAPQARRARAQKPLLAQSCNNTSDVVIW